MEVHIRICRQCELPQYPVLKMAEEAAKEYQKSIEDLTFNSKLHINVLTMIAGENHENGYAAETVKVIENHLKKVL